jgi:hypothetical protein
MVGCVSCPGSDPGRGGVRGQTPDGQLHTLHDQRSFIHTSCSERLRQRLAVDGQRHDVGTGGDGWNAAATAAETTASRSERLQSQVPLDSIDPLMTSGGPNNRGLTPGTARRPGCRAVQIFRTNEVPNGV